jgi:branched-chain amino acid transport system substrate-binding protein
MLARSGGPAIIAAPSNMRRRASARRANSTGREGTMTITRRGFVWGAAGAGLAARAGLRPAVAQSSEPIRIGWLAALTGPSSAPGVGFNRGVVAAVDEINAAGGVKGRKLELVTRDTQGDPTKAVNATQDMISRQKVHAIWGPTNSGEALATTPIMARAKMPSLHPCVVDTLIDVEKYPNAFRTAPANAQWDAAVRHYWHDILKLNDVAVIADTTGYGTTAAGASEAGIKQVGANMVYKALIDSSQPDVTADMTRAKNAGAKAIVIWSVSTGFLARLMNTRAQLDWDVPFVGHPSLGSGEVRQLLDKPANWDKVYLIGYRSCSYDAAGKLPARTAAFVARMNAAKVSVADTSLWWVAGGYDAVQLVAQAVAATGSSNADAIVSHWNTMNGYQGIFGNYLWSAQNHNGFPTDDVVMSQANSSRDGAFSPAPGYDS